MARLHEKALESFNEKAEDLLQSLGPAPPMPKSDFEPEIPVLGSVRPVTQEGLKMSHTVAGTEAGRFFATKANGWVGLTGHHFKRFQDLASRIASRPELRDLVSAATVDEILFEWLAETHEQVSELSFGDYLETEVEKRIGTFEFWIPVATLCLESDLPLGRVRFQPITAQQIDGWTSRWEDADVKTQGAGIASIREQWRNKIQGLAAATISITAEKQFAQQQAFDQAETALGMLRLFSAEILTPASWSLCSVEGLEMLGGSMLIVLRDGALDSVHRNLPQGLNYQWRVSDELIEKMNAQGLQDAHALLVEDEPSPFQSDLLRALQHYSISALKRDPAEKLLYVVTALDSLLSRGPEEGQVVQNFRERLALLRANDPNERAVVAARAKEIYTQRSRFVHGGIRPERLKTVEKFLLDAWVVFHQLLINHRFFRDKKQFLETLDMHKMAGPPVGKIRAK